MQNSVKDPVTGIQASQENASDGDNQKLFLLITGMDRSGTSFLARALNLCGVYLGDPESLSSDEWRRLPGNRRGFWEHKKFVELVRKIDALNPEIPFGVSQNIIITEEIGHEIRSYTQKLLEHPSLAAGIKVPGFVSYLASLLEYLPKNTKVVGIFRHPLEVAESLRTRHDFSYEKSLNLWKNRNQQLLSFLEKHDGFLLNFDWPKERLLAEISLIANKLGLAGNIDLSQWYTEELLHSDKTYDSNYPLSNDIRSLYTELQTRAEQNAKIQINHIGRTPQEYMEVIQGLLTEIRTQGNYFLFLSDKRTDNPMGALLTMYSQREDLQVAFPEVRQGGYTRLLEWADKHGTTTDDQKELLLEHKDWYKSQLVKVKKPGRPENVAMASVKIIREEGMRSFLHKAHEKIRRREFEILEDPFTQSSLHEAYRLRPCSPEQYKLWMSLNQPSAQKLNQMRSEIGQLSYRPRITVCMAVYNPEQHYLSNALTSVLNQVYEDWELIIVDDHSDRPHVRPFLISFAEQDKRIRLYLKETNEGAPKALNEAFAKAAGDYVVIVDHDDVLEPHALYELARYLNEEGRDSDLTYSDESLIDTKDEVIYIYFRPDFSPDLLLSHCYFVHMVAIKRSFLEKMGGFDRKYSVTWDYDFYLRAMTQTKKIGHIPKVLYRYRMHENSVSHIHKDKVMEQAKMALANSMKTMGIDGTVEDGLLFNFFRVKRRLKDELLSVIIPTKNVYLLQRCIDSIEGKTKYENYEIIIVANNISHETKAYLEKVASTPRYRICYYDKPFNFSGMCNYAVSLAKGDHLLFLNDDTEILTEGSIESMLEHSQREEVGAVGAKLLYPNDRIQHAGVVIGLLSACEHVHKFHPAKDPGYCGWLIAIRDCTAVSGACMMIPRKVFERVGGFDEQLSITYNDIDLCLRIRKLGYLVVYTPYAVLHHYEQATRKSLPTVHPYQQDMLFRKRWKELIWQGDPYYNPNLSPWHYDCRPRFNK